MHRFRWLGAWLSLATAVACAGTVKVESGAAGGASNSSGTTGSAGDVSVGAPSVGGTAAVGGYVGVSVGAPSVGGTAAVGGYVDIGAGAPSVGGTAAVGGYVGVGVGGESGAGGEPDLACEVDLVVHLVGQPFACACNTCWCEPDGTIASSDSGCKVCVYMGEIHAPGETFPDRDGCNTCECSSTGKVNCTEKACACQPEKEWFRHYVSNSAKRCSVIDFACPTNTTTFDDSCGCGCEEAVDCPQWIDCEPGNLSCATMMKRCPYSAGAF